MDQELLIIIGVVAAMIVVALVVLVVMAVRRRKDRERLRERFGPEYDHAVEAEGERKAAEDLHGRVDERKQFTPGEADEHTRADLRRRMAVLQYRFVDDPADVLLETQRVITDALRACGYPVADDRERALKLLSVDHPNVTPPLRTLLEGSYGRDVGRMHELFAAAKHALRDVVHVGYSQNDLQAAEPTAGAGVMGDGSGTAAPRERPAPATGREPAPAPRDQDAPAAPRDQDAPAAPRDEPAHTTPARDQDAATAPRDQDAPAAPRDQDAPAAPRDQDAATAPRDQDAPAAPRDEAAPAPSQHERPASDRDVPERPEAPAPPSHASREG